MRGRKPKPIAQQIAEGDPRKRGAHKLIELQNCEPPVTKGLPACPRHLKGYARAAWNFWADELAKMNLDCRPDAQMLQGACLSFSRALQAEKILDKEGPVVRESIIHPETNEIIVLKHKTHPAFTVATQSWRLMHRFCTEFGLSPVSRTRLSIDKQDKHGEDLAEILNRPRPSKPAGEQTVQ